MYPTGMVVQYHQDTPRRTSINSGVLSGVVTEKKVLARTLYRIEGRWWVAKDRIITPVPVSNSILLRQAKGWVKRYILWMSRAPWHEFARKWAMYAAKEAYRCFDLIAGTKCKALMVIDPPALLPLKG